MISFNTLIPFLLLNSFVTYAKLSDQRLCANPDCTELISLAKTLILYSAPEKGILSFKPQQDVKVFSKSAGIRADLWGVEINGKRGYAPHKLIREIKVLKNKLEHLVPTENNQENTITANPTINTIPKENIPDDKTSTEYISPNSVTPSYEIIDGTKIYGKFISDTETNNNIVTDNIQHSKSALPETTTIPTPDSNIFSNNVNSNIKEKETIEINKNENKFPENNKNPETISQKLEENVETQEKRDKIKDISKAIDELSQKVKRDFSEHVIKSTNDNSEENENETVVDDDEDEDEDDDDKDDDDKDDDQYDDNGNDDGDEEEKNIPNVSESKFNGLNLNKKIEGEQKENEEFLIKNKNEETFVKKENENILINNETPINNKSKENQIEKKNDEIAIPKSNEDISKGTTIVGDKTEHNSKEADAQEPLKMNNGFPENMLNVINDVQKENIKSDILLEVNKTEAVQVENSKEVPLNNLNQTDLDRNDIKENLLPNVEKKVPENVETLSTEVNIETTPAPNLQFTTEQNIPEMPVPLFENRLDTFTVNPIDAITVNSENLDEDDKTELPVVQPLTGMPEIIEEIDTTTEEVQNTENINTNLPNIEKSIEINKEEGSGIFSKIYTGLFGSEEAKHEDLNNINIDLNNKKNDLLNEENVQPSIETIKPIENFNINEELSPTENEKDNISIENTDSTNDLNQSEEIKHIIEENLNLENLKSSEEIEMHNTQIKQEDSKNFEQHTHEKPFDKYLQNNQDDLKNEISNEMQNCELMDNPSECSARQQENLSKTDVTEDSNWSIELIENDYNLLLYMSLTAITVLLFVLGHYYIEKKRIDSNLISNINTLEQKLLVTSKENLLLHDELKTTKDRLLSIEDSSFGTDEMVSALKTELEEAKVTRIELEEKINNLERELENATEAGLESNRMLAEFLSSQHGIESIMENVESLQKQLFEQQTTINNMNVTLNTKNTENELLQTELSVSNDKIEQLQSELDKMVVNLLSVQEEKSKVESDFEEQTKILKEEYEIKIQSINKDIFTIKEDNNKLKGKLSDLQSKLNLKINEYTVLKESMNEVQAINSNKESMAALLDVSKVKAEVQQLREEKHNLIEKLQIEKETKTLTEKQVQVVMQEMQILKDKYEEADKEKVEAQTRLDVLSAYFKEKEAQLQKEISEHESLWVQKQGEATSTVERIKWIQEELQNYKSQNELLKKEILDQEVSLKSQISMLEKKVHDNWILARQAERKLEESKQEASQLRNRLTVVEKNLSNTSLINQSDDGKLPNRILQPIESNGDIAVSPLHMGTGEPPGSPPLLFSHREHITTSPPLPGMPPPFMPPPGVPFMPPPPGVPPFMPPLPPALFSGDHRPPPLGRMSPAPIHGRYSPISFSPYDRDDLDPPLSPTYPDSDYRRRRSPPPPHSSRTFSPYSNKSRGREWEDVRDYRDRPPQQQQRMKPRNHKGTGLSSGSGNSNESLDNSGRHSGRV